MPRRSQEGPPAGEAALFSPADAGAAALSSPPDGQPASLALDPGRRDLPAADIVQLRCSQPDGSGQPCIAWRLSRPDGQTWRPCWRCQTSLPPVQAARAGIAVADHAAAASE
jgi:hypothetical protein